jgi:hypothetical protein
VYIPASWADIPASWADIPASWARALPLDVKGLLDEHVYMAMIVYRAKGKPEGFSGWQSCMYMHLTFPRTPEKKNLILCHVMADTPVILVTSRKSRSKV